jgi:hypothetical protein
VYFERPRPKVSSRQTEEPVKPIKAATPEDPGPIATVVSPLKEWTKAPKAEEVQDVSGSSGAFDHVSLTPTPQAQNFLHQSFPLHRAVKVEFSVAARSKSPRLHGRADSWIEASGERRPAAVEILLLTASEYSDFLHGRGTATRFSEASSSQSIDWLLSPTADAPVRYFLIFRNPVNDGQARQINANFSVDYE